MTEVKKNENKNFNILTNGQVIGHIRLVNRTDISYVKIDEDYTGNGHGPRALREAIRKLKQYNEKIHVSTPVDDSLEHVLKSEGFTKDLDRYVLSVRSN
jgi:predicted GNAT family N-acyltransferase